MHSIERACGWKQQCNAVVNGQSLVATYTFSNIPPSVTSYTPQVIPTVGGRMSISGTQLGQVPSDVSVDIDGMTVQFNAITVVTPGTNVAIQIPKGFNSGRTLHYSTNGFTVNMTFSYAAPVINTAAVNQNNILEIYGNNFGDGTAFSTVTVDGGACNITFINDSLIQCGIDISSNSPALLTVGNQQSNFIAVAAPNQIFVQQPLPIYTTVGKYATAVDVMSSTNNTKIAGIYVPPGTFNATTFDIQPVNASLLNDSTLLDDPRLRSIVLNLTTGANHNATMKQKVSISLPITDQSDPKSLCLAFINETTNEWECVDDNVQKNDDSNPLYTGLTPHFTNFGILFTGNSQPQPGKTIPWPVWIGVGCGAAAIVATVVGVGFKVQKTRARRGKTATEMSLANSAEISSSNSREFQSTLRRENSSSLVEYSNSDHHYNA